MLKRIVKETLLDSGVVELIDGVYLFGSSLSSVTPKDIDILIVYNDLGKNRIRLIIKFKSLVSMRIKDEVNKNVDIVLLNLEEYAETGYKLLNKIVIAP
jgi:predicted nucleotidyltransferase